MHTLQTVHHEENMSLVILKSMQQQKEIFRKKKYVDRTQLRDVRIDWVNDERKPHSEFIVRISGTYTS